VDALSNALGGMQAATWRFDAAAHRNSTADTPDEQPPGVDLATEMVSMLTARATYAANARVVDAARETGRSLLDALA
jgi:flagellar hook-associated protein FlgK